MVLLLFHRFLNGQNPDPVVVAEQLRPSHKRLNQEAQARRKSEKKYQRIVQRNIRKSRKEGLKEKRSIAIAEKKKAKAAKRNLKNSEPDGWDFD